MKVLSFATLLAAASVGRASAADDDASKLAAALLTIEKSIQEPAHGSSLSEDDWTSQLACTADLSSQQPSLIDEATCSATKDSNGQGCIWCDATAAIGSGLCMSQDQKAMLGAYWDQLCANSSSVSPPAPDTPPAPPATEPPTMSPTSPPTEPAPAPAPDSDVPDQLKCLVDASGNTVSDEATCLAQKDATGESCAWCNAPLIGGTCVSSSMKSQLSFLCGSSADGAIKKEGHLRGDNNGGGGWKQLDPSCLGDNTGLAGDKDSCASRTDSNGSQCIWCDAGNDVFGICATPSQKEYLGGYMDCEAGSEDVGVHAVELSPVAVE